MYSAKISSENKDEIAALLRQIYLFSGYPHAVVSDMNQAIQAAVVEVFGNILHFIWFICDSIRVIEVLQIPVIIP